MFSEQLPQMLQTTFATIFSTKIEITKALIKGRAENRGLFNLKFKTVGIDYFNVIVRGK